MQRDKTERKQGPSAAALPGDHPVAGTVPGNGGGRSPLPAGLHIVATPIGNARDVTLRALDVLREADVLAAEDTRRLRQLMAIHGIAINDRRIFAHHDHNAEHSGRELVAMAKAGQVVAYASDAGTPLVSDPGFELVRLARDESVPVHAVPGASAVLAALTVAGLPTDRFLFAGFVPAAAGARRSWLQEMADTPSTVVMFDSPRRVKETFKELCEIAGDRSMVICRELTKRFEEVLRGSAATLYAEIPPEGLRGEIVVLMGPAPAHVAGDDDVRRALSERLGRLSVKDAAAEVARELGVPRRRAYQLAMEMK